MDRFQRSLYFRVMGHPITLIVLSIVTVVLVIVAVSQ